MTNAFHQHSLRMLSSFPWRFPTYAWIYPHLSPCLPELISLHQNSEHGEHNLTAQMNTARSGAAHRPRCPVLLRTILFWKWYAATISLNFRCSREGEMTNRERIKRLACDTLYHVSFAHIWFLSGRSQKRYSDRARRAYGPGCRIELGCSMVVASRDLFQTPYMACS
jgi:hypothetical protein